MLTRQKLVPARGIEPRSARYKLAALPLCYAGEIGVTYGDRTRRDAFTARRVLQFTKATILRGFRSAVDASSPLPEGERQQSGELEVRAGLEPALSRFAGERLALQTIAPYWHRRSRIELSCAGLESALFTRTRRYRNGSPRWNRTSLIPG